MIKTTLRIALTPAILIVRLLLGLTAFITSIASSILGLSVPCLPSCPWLSSSLDTGKTVLRS